MFKKKTKSTIELSLWQSKSATTSNSKIAPDTHHLSNITPIISNKKIGELAKQLGITIPDSQCYKAQEHEGYIGLNVGNAKDVANLSDTIKRLYLNAELASRACKTSGSYVFINEQDLDLCIEKLQDELKFQQVLTNPSHSPSS